MSVSDSGVREGLLRFARRVGRPHRVAPHASQLASGHHGSHGAKAAVQTRVRRLACWPKPMMTALATEG